MKPAVLGLTAWALVITPAVALEGRFATADGSVEVAISPRADGGFVVQTRGVAATGDVSLPFEPGPEPGVFIEPAEKPTWGNRLLGTTTQPTPFEGDRLRVANRDATTLVITFLAVNAVGQPTLDRVILSEAGGRVSLEHEQVTVDGIATADPITLDPVTP